MKQLTKREAFSVLSRWHERESAIYVWEAGGPVRFPLGTKALIVEVRAGGECVQVLCKTHGKQPEEKTIDLHAAEFQLEVETQDLSKCILVAQFGGEGSIAFAGEKLS